VISGFNASNVSFFVLKAELPAGIRLSLTGGSVANGDDWTLTETA